MGAIVQFENVGLRYGTGAETLSDISFTLAQGAFYLLTGASGAGKTSLLRLLYLAQRPSRGLIRLFGEDVVTLPRERMPGFRRRIGVVFQDFRLIPYLSAFDNVALPLRVAGMDEREIETPVNEMLAWVGLTSRAEARPATLSGGEQQRVALARALAPMPALLIADEPTGNLDEATGREIMDLLFAKRAEHKSTLVIVTHDASLVKRCDRAIALRSGHIEQKAGEAVTA